MNNDQIQRLKARSDAVYYISSRLSSSGKVKNLLIKKGYPEFLAQEIVNELLDEKRIDDRAFASAIIKSRKGSKVESSMALTLRIIRAGVPEAIAQDCVKSIFLAENSDYNNARQLLNLKFSSKADTIHSRDYDEYKKFTAKMYRFLLSRGYSDGIASSAVIGFNEDKVADE